MKHTRKEIKLTLDPEILKKLEELKKETGLPKSRAVEAALKEYFDKLEKMGFFKQKK